MNKLTMELTFIKWACFSICLFGKVIYKLYFPSEWNTVHTLTFSAFLWKVVESYLSVLKKDIGTKTVLDSNLKYGLPSFAICRHSNQVGQHFSVRR